MSKSLAIAVARGRRAGQKATARPRTWLGLPRWEASRRPPSARERKLPRAGHRIGGVARASLACQPRFYPRRPSPIVSPKEFLCRRRALRFAIDRRQL